MSFETISVIGLGYIGLPTAAAFSSRQKKVIGVDVNQHAVDTINRGAIHIVAVSYTHLDVYKRQVLHNVGLSKVPRYGQVDDLPSTRHTAD